MVLIKNNETRNKPYLMKTNDANVVPVKNLHFGIGQLIN
jgi:hypothetical protein